MNSEKTNDDCLFCTMPQESDDENNRILFRGRHCFVLINAYPYSNGHVMVVCNRHVDKFGELSPDESGRQDEKIAVRLELGEVLFLLGQVAEARFQARSILDDHPDHEGARKLLERATEE